MKITYLLLLLIIISCGCINNTKEKQDKEKEKTTLKSFPMPTIPAMISSVEEKAKYIATKYWDKFDFSDTTLISHVEITEQGFVDFINILPQIKTEFANNAINTMLSKAQNADSVMFSHFLELYEKYLYDPNSPFRNEELYTVVLDYIVSSPNIDEINKIRPIYLLEVARKNRQGSIAKDFKFKLKNNRVGSLHKIDSDYTLIFFNNPNCGDCSRVKEYINTSPVINKLNNDRSLTILSLYPDKDLTAWLEIEYPESWINGYDQNQLIENNELYDLKAIPTLYLLGKNKVVILKDASIENIENWLNKNNHRKKL